MMRHSANTALMILAVFFGRVAAEGEVHMFPAGTYTSKQNLLQNIVADTGDIIDCRMAVFHQDNLNVKGANYPCKIDNNPGDVAIRWARIIGHVPHNIAWQTYYHQGNGCAISAFYGGGATFQDCFIGRIYRLDIAPRRRTRAAEKLWQEEDCSTLRCSYGILLYVSS